MSTVMDSNPKKAKSPISFITNLKEELKKISWTTKAQLISATKIVLFSMFSFGIGIYVVDLMIKGVLEGIKRTLMYIFG